MRRAYVSAFISYWITCYLLSGKCPPSKVAKHQLQPQKLSFPLLSASLLLGEMKTCEWEENHTNFRHRRINFLGCHFVNTGNTVQ